MAFASRAPTGPGEGHAKDPRETGTLLPLADDILHLTSQVAAPIGEIKPWEQRRAAERACVLLARLIEECEREQDSALRSRALDAWDALLESKTLAALAELEARSRGIDQASAGGVSRRG